MATSSPKAAMVVVDGDGHLDPLRMAMHGIEFANGSLALLCLVTAATLSPDEMLAEVDGAAQTLRRLQPPTR